MNGVKDNLCRTLSLLSLDARVKALRLAFEGSTRPRAAAETIGLSETQASRFYTELEDVGLVLKQRVGKALDIVADGDGVLRFLSELGQALVPGGVVIVPLDASRWTGHDALIAERVVVYDDPLPEVEPDREAVVEAWERTQRLLGREPLGVEGIAPPMTPQEIAAKIDELSWPELTGDPDAETYVDRVQKEWETDPDPPDPFIDGWREKLESERPILREAAIASPTLWENAPHATADDEEEEIIDAT